MRIHCPACNAPYTFPGEQPPDGTKCPNCDAPAPKAIAVPQRPPANPKPEVEGNSRVVNIIAIVHFLVAASGFCVFVGMTSVMSERGFDPKSRWFALTGVALAVMWAATGFGLLRRWIGAWALSLGLVITSIGYFLFAAVGGLGAGRNPCGMICFGFVFMAILFVLIGRRGEFR
jgi:hypothetical protein